MLASTRPVFTESCGLLYGLVSPHHGSHGGHSLTNSMPCPSLPFGVRPSESYVVTGMPTDVNWAVLKGPDAVQLSPRKSNIVKRSCTLARVLSDATSALLYNLGNIIILRAKPDRRAWRPSNIQQAYMQM